MPIKITIEDAGLRDLQGRFQRLADTGVGEAVGTGVRRVTELIYRQTIHNIRSMFRTSGKMENALRVAYTGTGATTAGSVSIGGIGYVTQELGGRRPFAIHPRNRLALAFEGEAGMTFAKLVIRGPLPARSYLRSAVDQVRGQIREEFAVAIRERVTRG